MQDMKGACVSQEVSEPASLVAGLCQEHGAFVRMVIAQRFSDPHDVDEIFQRVFLALVAHPPENVYNPQGFLFRCATLECVDYRRRQRVQKDLRERYAQQLRIHECPLPEQELMDQEEQQRAFKLVDSGLKGPYAVAIRLKYKDGCDTDQVSRRMNVRKASAQCYLSRGLRKLRQLAGVKNRKLRDEDS